jgi:succinate dehydrogenase / fumarate reductase cytochrome b subunit
MSLLGNLFRSTIGRKFLMAVTGVVLIGFVVGHLVGNLQVFEDPDKINGYAHFLQSLGPGLWAARIILLICVGIHIWASAVLTIESKRARGPDGWAEKTWLQATLQSRSMRWTGVVVLAFIFYHLAHFTFGGAQAATFKENLPLYTMKSDYHVMGFTAVREGSQVLDVHSMVILGFEPFVVDLFYIIAVGLLSVHMLHGAESLFQTLGWRNSRWGGGLRVAVTIFCAAYFLGNLAIPGSVLTGALKPRAPLVAKPATPVVH